MTHAVKMVSDFSGARVDRRRETKVDRPLPSVL